MTTIAARVARVVAKAFNHPEADIRPETHVVNDLGADELGILELTIDLESEFGLDLLPDSDLETCRTVAEWTAAIERATKGA